MIYTSGRVLPAELFRCLLGRPPSTSIECALPVLEGAALSVVACSSLTRASIADEAMHTQIGYSTRLVAECLRVDGCKETPRTVASLDLAEFETLHKAVCAGLEVCSPWFDMIDQKEWIRVLKVGAEAPPNILAAHLIGSCETAAQYFGTMALTDGQWLAWLAARELYLARQKQ